jgi:hypothetical protein
MNSEMTTEDIAFLPQLTAKVATALAENADIIAADPTLWRQDVTPLTVMWWMLNVMSVSQLHTLYVDSDQLANVLVMAISV